MTTGGTGGWIVDESVRVVAIATHPAGSQSPRHLVGDDGTIAVTAITGTGVETDPYVTTVTILHAGTAEPRTVTTDGQPGWTYVKADGTVEVVTFTGADDAADPLVSHVTVVRPGEATIERVTAPGNVAVSNTSTVRVGGGAIARWTKSGTGTDADPIVTSVAVNRPDGPSHSMSVVGFLAGFAVREDGTAVTTTFDGSGFDDDPRVTTVSVLGAAGSGPPPVQVRGTPTGRPGDGPVQGADGTVAQTVLSGDPDGPDLVVVIVCRPDRTELDVMTLPGTPVGCSVAVGDDGTVAQTSYTVPAIDASFTTMAVLRPGRAEPVTVTLADYPHGSPVAGAEGSVAQVTRTNSRTRPPGMYLTVLRADDDEPDTWAVTGRPLLPPAVGADGTVALTSSGDAGVGPTVTTVTLLRREDRTPSTSTIAGRPRSPAVVGADGTVAQLTEDGPVTAVTLMRPGSARQDTVALIDTEVVATHADCHTMRVLSRTGAGDAADPIAYTLLVVPLESSAGQHDS